MTETEYEDIMQIIRHELEDIEVEEDGTCHWGDVANANTHIQARLRRLLPTGASAFTPAGSKTP